MASVYYYLWSGLDKLYLELYGFPDTKGQVETENWNRKLKRKNEAESGNRKAEIRNSCAKS
jgi:hypothetical protein